MGTEMTRQENALPHKSNNLSSDPQNPGKSQTQGCICTYPQEDGRQTRATSELTGSLVSCKADTVLNKVWGGGMKKTFKVSSDLHMCSVAHMCALIYNHTRNGNWIAQCHPWTGGHCSCWVLGMKRGHQTAEAAEAPYKCQPAALPWKESVVLTTDCLNIQRDPQPSEQTRYSPTPNHYCYLVSQVTPPTCCSVKPACIGHRWSLRRRGWHHVWCVDLSSVSSTTVPGRLQWSRWRTHTGQLITQKHFLWGWSGSAPLFLVGRALSWATRATC